MLLEVETPASTGLVSHDPVMPEAPTVSRGPPATPHPTSPPTATNVSQASPKAQRSATLAPTASPTSQPQITPTPAMTPDMTTIQQRADWLLHIAGGTFTMGVSPATLQRECARFQSSCPWDLFAPSGPAHEVELPGFYIDRTEVTNASFLTFLNEASAHLAVCEVHTCYDTQSGDIFLNPTGVYAVAAEATSLPVRSVSWYGAAAYCTWRGGRLPSEAEWEKVASWDAASGAKRLYPWGEAFSGHLVNFCDSQCGLRQAAWALDDGYAQTSPVGSFPLGASPYGALDMAGNLWEWVADWFAHDYYRESDAIAPTGPATGSERVVRGGSWFDRGVFTSTVVRFPAPPEITDDSIGFRCAADAPE